MLLRYRSTSLPWLSARWIFRNRMHHQGPYIVPAAAALSMLPPPGPGFRPHIQGAVRYRKTFLLRPTVWLVRIVQASGTAVLGLVFFNFVQSLIRDGDVVQFDGVIAWCGGSVEQGCHGFWNGLADLGFGPFECSHTVFGGVEC